MSDWDDGLRDSALGHLISLGAESVTYTTRTASRTIYALIERNPIMPVSPYGTSAASIDVWVFAGDNTDGVTAPNIGADKITFKARLSDATAQAFSVQEIIKQDAGLWHLRVHAPR